MDGLTIMTTTDGVAPPFLPQRKRRPATQNLQRQYRSRSVRSQRRLFALLLLLLLGCHVQPTVAFVPFAAKAQSTGDTGSCGGGGGRAAGPPTRSNHRASPARTPSSRSSSRNVHTNTIHTEEANLVPASLAVGALTATLGFVYGKILSTCVQTVWHTLPGRVWSTSSRSTVTAVTPTLWIPTVLTAGGLAMGLLSHALRHRTFAVADFVQTLSASDPVATATVPSTATSRVLPSCRTHLLPLLLLSLVTSLCGFSVGPEAPMVCAGGLVGASVGRKKWFQRTSTANNSSERNAQVPLAYAGAAGALTAFMGIPLAGSVFALELTRSTVSPNGSSGGGGGGGGDSTTRRRDHWSPAILASLSAMVVLRGVLNPHGLVGGHFGYGTSGAATTMMIQGRSMLATVLASSVLGAGLGIVFQTAVAWMKARAWTVATTKKASSSSSSSSWKRPVLVKTSIGLMVGILSLYYPQTLFWGEGSLQCAIDGQVTAFGATPHGLPSALLGRALVQPNLPFATPVAALQVGVAKLAAIALACAGKFPGGIIFPLFFAAAPFAHALFGAALSTTTAAAASSSIIPLAVMCTMAATQASVTRTPLATALILSLSASPATPLSALLPACLMASYGGVYVAQFLSSRTYFSYAQEQSNTTQET